MGKPVRGEGQLPFGIGGFLVSGAKIGGETFDKTLFINKQRSYNLYDLIDQSGKIYQFIQLVYRDENNITLDYFDTDAELSKTLANGTFYLKVQDPARNIYGFATLYMYNLVKVNTGQYIYRQNQDSLLSGVYVDPNHISLNVNKSFTINANFIPEDYKNKSGKWYYSNNKVSGVSDGPNVTVTGLEEGTCIVSFVPDSNDTHTAHTIIDVVSEPITVTSVQFYFRDDSSDYTNVTRYFNKGDEFTISAVILPLSVIPTEPFEFDFDQTFLEYIGTENNIDYKFKVKDFISENQYNYLTITGSTTEFGNFSTSIRFYACAKTLATSLRISGAYYLRPGMTSQFTSSTSTSTYVDSPVVWSSSAPSIMSIDPVTGFATAHAEGSVRISAKTNTASSFTTCYIKNNAPDYVWIEPTDLSNAIVGETYQMTAHFEPDTIPVQGVWKIMEGQVPGAITVTSTGEMTVHKAGGNSVSYLEFVPSSGGCTYGIGWPYYTKVLFTNTEYKPISKITGYGTTIPVGSTSTTYFGFTPYDTSEWGCTFVVDDPSVATVEFKDPLNLRKGDPRMEYITVTGLKRGSTTVTATSVYNPAIVATIQIIVF